MNDVRDVLRHMTVIDNVFPGTSIRAKETIILRYMSSEAGKSSLGVCHTLSVDKPSESFQVRQRA